MTYLKFLGEFILTLAFFGTLFVGLELICIANDACYASLTR